MSSKAEKNAELRQYLKENCDQVMQDQILNLLKERPDDVYEFINNWASKKLSNELGSEVKINDELNDELRKSMPKMVYPEDLN